MSLPEFRARRTDESWAREALDALDNPVLACAPTRSGGRDALRIAHANSAAAQALGLTADLLVGEDLERVAPALASQEVREACRATAESGEAREIEALAPAAAPGALPGDAVLRLRLLPLDESGVVITWVDPAARDRDELELLLLRRQLARVYLLLVRTNEAIVRTGSAAELLEEVCNVAVLEGGFRMAWAGLLDEDSQAVRPVASAGTTGGYLDREWSMDPGRSVGRGPTGTALRTGLPVVVYDITTDERMVPWRAAAADLGYRSSAAFPLWSDGGVVGCLNLYAPEADAFSDREVELFQQLATDIGVGLERLAAAQERRASRLALSAAEQRYRGLFERAAQGLFVTTAEGTFAEVNPAMASMFAYGSPAEMTGGRLEARSLFADPVEFDRVLGDLRGADGVTARDVRLLRCDGAEFWGRLDAIAPPAVPEAIQGMVLDITAQRRVEVELRERLHWTRVVGDALIDQRFVVFAQPIVDLRQGLITQCELLVRLRSRDSPDHLVPPAEFLPAAERFELVTDIDRFMLGRALALARAGRTVQVNLSAVSLGNPAVLADLHAGLAHGDVDPARIVFEITESAAVRNLDESVAFAHRIREAGCALALDDFGVGFGAMTYLRHLDLAYLKIDASFVRDLAHSESDQSMVRTIVGIARDRGLRTIAEGVESADALDVLRELGVDLAQGYLLGRPGPVFPDDLSGNEA